MEVGKLGSRIIFAMGYDLVHVGYCNSTRWTKWLINNRDLFLIILETAKSKIKALADLVSGESPHAGLQMTIFSLCPMNLGESR